MFTQECRRCKTLEEVWRDDGVKAAKKALREKFQKKVSGWAEKDRKTRPPVYISLKPKVKPLGMYFAKQRGKGNIVLFPIRAEKKPPITDEFHVLSEEEMLETLKHEYAHHVARDIPHGKRFKDAEKAMARR